MSQNHILRTITFKIYPNRRRAETLEKWLRTCCWLYNQALEHRIKAYKRRGQHVSFADQTIWLTQMRKRMPHLASVPYEFAKDALRRVDRGMKAFFRRVKAGDKPGFPRFRSHQCYNSLEYLKFDSYVRPSNLLSVPKLGLVRFRAGNQSIPGQQKLLRIIRRASGWYAQVLIGDGQSEPPKVPIQQSVGVDVGLESFASLSNGEKIENPRFLRISERKLKCAQRRLSRKVKGSRNRRKAVRRVARIHERIREQRRDFAHRESRKLVDRFDLIGFENLNIKGLASGMLAKSIADAAWGMFLFFLVYKAECAGKRAIAVDPRRTSQECPGCGMVKKKELSERVHLCQCGAFIDRDVAAALVIHARALGVVGANACGGNGLCAVSNHDASHVDETGSQKQFINC